MINYIFNVTGYDNWLQVAKKLKNNDIAKPILLFGNDKCSNEIVNEFGEIHFNFDFHTYFPYKSKKTQYNSYKYDYFESTNYLKAKDRCIKMMDRIDFFGQFSRIDREVYFHQLVLKYLTHLNNLFKNPDTIPHVYLSVENPHSHSQYLLFNICDYLGIPCYKFTNWNFLPLIYIENICSKKRFQNKIHRTENINDININKSLDKFIKNLSTSPITHVYGYMKQQKAKKNFVKKLKSILIDGLKEIKFNIDQNFQTDYFPLNPTNLNFITRAFIKSKRKSKLKSKIFLSHYEIDDFLNYVYFPLHFEPERTTNPDGGDFHDQLLAILKIREFIPENITIVVKEHPSTYLLGDKGVNGRSPLFFDLLSNIKNIKIVHVEKESKLLISKSKMVATISGSVAVEAALMGVRSVYLGDTWYNGLPNTFKLDKNLTYENLLNVPLASIEKITSFLKKLKNEFSIIGFQNPGQKKYFNDLIDTNSSTIDEDMFNLLSSFFKKIEY